LLRVAVVLDVNQAIADRFGSLRAAQLDSGTPIPQLDLFIAATALEHQLIVVTHNTKHFASIPGLQFVDWLAP
jgi:predicted nucleic acid-binding protein